MKRLIWGKHEYSRYFILPVTTRLRNFGNPPPPNVDLVA